MKRGAERQISKDDGEDFHTAEGDEQAAPQAAAGGIGDRPIRGLPKRKMAGSPFSTPTASPSVNLFSSQSPAPSAAPVTPMPSFSFSTPSAPAPSAPTFTMGSSGTAASNGTSKAADDDVDYYRSLRGLNVSLKAELSSAISRELEKDAFVDVGPLLRAIEEKYKGHRTKVDADRKKAPSSTSSFAGEPSAASSTASSSTAAPAASKTFSFTAPSSTSNASTAPSATSTSSSAKSQPTFSLPSTTTPAVPFFIPSTSAAATASSTNVKTTTSEPKPPTLPKAPTSAFSFAGSSFKKDSDGAAVAEDKKLLPGQPTFTVPKGGFFASFGSNQDADGEEDEVEDEEDEQDEEEDQGEDEDEEEGGQDDEEEEEKNEAEDQAAESNKTGSAKPLFAFGSSGPAATNSSSTTSFGQQNSATTPSPSPFGSFGSFSSPNPTSTTSAANPFRFSFGSSPTSSPSSSASTATGTSAAAPSVGFSFANTSGVSNPGAFSFGQSKIAFGGETKEAGKKDGEGDSK